VEKGKKKVKIREEENSEEENSEVKSRLWACEDYKKK